MKKQIGQLPACIVSRHFLYLFLFLLLPIVCLAQINTGSDGSDGPFNPTANTVINMATHPNGIYQYTSVNIPANVTVTFTPNASNTPVVWLVKGSVVIKGSVDISGGSANGYPSSAAGALGGPGGYRGGTGGPSPTSGQGPGGGLGANYSKPLGGQGGYGTPGSSFVGMAQPGQAYGNDFLLPLLGGSGGGGSYQQYGYGGGGGGGAILIAASGFVEVDGHIVSAGGNYDNTTTPGGTGSGGAIRIVAAKISGSGELRAYTYYGAAGRVRFDTYENDFGGSIAYAVFTQGFQPIIIPSAGQLPQLTVISVGGVPVSPSPTGVLSTPDAVLSAQQNNPVPIVVQCSNLPLNTPITVSVKPANGLPISAVGYNAGTLVSSTATVSLNMPRGGGLIYATAATGN